MNNESQICAGGVYLSGRAGAFVALLFVLLALAPSALLAAEPVSVPKPRFPIWEFVIAGNTLLDNKIIEQEIYPYLGMDRSIDTVQAAKKALQALYRQAGYPTVLVNIPVQDTKDAVIRLQVVEGSVDRLRISGADYFLPSLIRAAVPALQVGHTPHLPTVQRQLAALGGQTADRQLTPVLRPGRTPGHLEVELRVKDQLPLHGSLELNGRNSASTTRTRLSGNIRYDNLWQRLHSLSLSYQVSPEKIGEVSVLSATYMLPFSLSADDRVGQERLVIYGIRSRSKSEIASAGDLSVIGDGDVLGLRGIINLAGSAEMTHRLSLGLDYKDFRENIVLTGADTLRTPITYLPFAVNYDRNWRSGARLSHFGLGMKFALRGLVGQQDEFDNKRFLARADFLIVTGAYDQSLPLFAGLRLHPRLAFQLAGAPLISNEQYGIGGMNSVRGYHESQALGDDGFSAGLEFESPRFLKPRVGFDDLHALYFLEGGRVNIHSPLPGTKRHQALLSTGFGLRWQGWHRYTINTDVAYPLLDNVDVSKGDWRVDFQLRGAF